MSVFSTFYNEGREHIREWVSRFIAVLVLGFLFFVTAGGISQHPRWHIDRIDVTGTQAVDRDAVLALSSERLWGNYFYVYSHSNSYLFPASTIEKAVLSAFPRVGRVYASRVNDHTIAVDVVERKPFALWCGEFYSPTNPPLCYFIDDTGFVFDRAPTFSSGVYLELYGVLVGKSDMRDPIGGYLPQQTFMWMYEVNKGLADNIGGVLRISAKENLEFDVVMGKSSLYPMTFGTVVHTTYGTNARTLVKNLGKALMTEFPRGAVMGESLDLSRTLYYIDMRFGNKIFFGFEPEEVN